MVEGYSKRALASVLTLSISSLFRTLITYLLYILLLPDICMLCTLCLTTNFLLLMWVSVIITIILTIIMIMIKYCSHVSTHCLCFCSLFSTQVATTHVTPLLSLLVLLYLSLDFLFFWYVVCPSFFISLLASHLLLLSYLSTCANLSVPTPPPIQLSKSSITHLLNELGPHQLPNFPTTHLPITLLSAHLSIPQKKLLVLNS